jgi:glycosyltransferase involved in cell wall biosynthesis
LGPIMSSTPTVFYVRDDTSEEMLRSYMPDTLTVIMPAFNAAGTIEESIRSVMAQTYKEWVLLVIDDGSTDDTLQICERLAAEDPRIIPVSVSHRGLCAVLNLGLRVSRGQLIARMDADDLSYPTRFSKQVEFLAAHPSVKVLGTWGERINANSQVIARFDIGPSTVSEYHQWIANSEPIALIHSSVMAERTLLLEYSGYRHEEYPAEDLWLWTRIANNHVTIALPERLVQYRISNGGISSRQFRVQRLQHERLLHFLRTREHVDLDTFRARCHSNPFRWLAFQQRYLHRYYFREGAGHFCNERKLRGALYLALSALADPVQVLNRVIARS